MQQEEERSNSPTSITSLTSLFAHLPPLQQRPATPRRIQEPRPQLFVTPDGRIVDNPSHPGDEQNEITEDERIRRHAAVEIKQLSEKEAKEICSVCHEIYEDEKGAVLPNCQHVFHEKCIKKWLDQKNTCPLCQTTVA
ncbi:Oidioi.mRNA.OKI2018_I69.chr1.g611.t1.cds [Oikopleura dioica]|uniref:RING-type E3 ubiquitin transferase n=1 Tax=Oikopleura dioica TaxID=34765 RepID=A0ABN7SKV9_OIKDI|nr:Oidioi.mRNA.OKI2018_I69.chr1.g611.t1.cds [Oikopleura dioica]